MSACLMLHGTGPVPDHIEDAEKPYWVNEECLAGIIDLAKKHAWRLTIDDGNASDTAVVLPRLLKAGVKASFFIPSDRIGMPGYVRADDIRALHEAGMEVGSHGAAHVPWTGLSDSEIVRDVTHSVEILSAIIGAPVSSAAIPYGRCDRRVLRILRNLGISRVYSSFRGPDSGNSWLVRRDCIMADMRIEEVAQLAARQRGTPGEAITFLKIWRRAGNAALWAA